VDLGKPVTPDLLAETGYRYTLNWCHDDQPVRMRTRNGGALWSVPYPQELNDIPMIIGRQMDARDFFAMVRRQLRGDAGAVRAQPLVMGLALHPYIVGQPYRLRHLRTRARAPGAARDRGASGSPRRGRSRRKISILLPSSTTELLGRFRKSRRAARVWCICANSFSRHCAMPLPMVGITVSRDRK
jgi:hypothetical protein